MGVKTAFHLGKAHCKICGKRTLRFYGKVV